ncbi:MAG: DUF362 domain-containing protein [Chloroflexota bacterium]
MAKSVVSIAKGTDPEKMIEEALNLLGGVSSLIKAGSTVVIKPNIIGMYPAERSITTSPPFVAAAIKVLRKANPKQIILAESSAMRRDTDKCLDISGIRAAAEKAGVDKIVDIKKEQDLVKLPIRDHRSDLTSILMPRFMVEAEHIVNLPIYKCHVSAVFSCCMKNIKGTVQDKVHYQMHQTDLAAAMMDVWSVLRMDLNIVDMINPLEGFGPLGGIPHTGFGCVIAGKDPVATDATACRMVGLPVVKAPFFPYAAERGLGVYDEKDIEIRGKKIKEVFKQLWIPYLTGGWEQWPEYKIINEGACSSCQGLLAYGLERLKSLDAYDKNAGMTVCLGRIKEVPKGVKKEDLILMGDCIPKKLRDQGLFVEGCPPLEFQPTWTMIDKKYEPPGVYTRNYMDEIAKFFEYSKKVRDQWQKSQAKAPKAKGKTKK